MSNRLRISYLRGLYRIASGSLIRHRLRSFLSVLGIICGVSAVFATLSIGEGAKREVLAGIRQLGLENIIIRRVQLADSHVFFKHSGSVSGLGLQDIAMLRSASPAITDIAYLKELQVELPGAVRQLTPQVVACSASYFDVLGIRVSSGRIMLDQDEVQKKSVCLLGANIAKTLGRQGQPGSQIRIGDQMFLVAGVVSPVAPFQKKSESGAVRVREIEQMVFIPFGTHEYFSHGANTNNEQALDEVIVQMNSQEAAEQLLPLIQRSLSISHKTLRDYQIIVPRQLMEQARNTQRIFNLVLAAIGGISLVVGGIGIMNVLLATISERTREIGIRRAVGATREDIMAQFLMESLLLTSCGGILGIVAGFGCSLIIAKFADWSIAVNFFTVFLPLGTSVLVGFCAGVYPAVKAGSMNPVQALYSQ